MAEIAVRPRGPYSLALSARLAGDATRRVHDGVITARLGGAVARAWQSGDGTVTIRSESTGAAEKLRWVLALDDDHSEFLRRVADEIAAHSEHKVGVCAVHLCQEPVDDLHRNVGPTLN